MVLKQEAGIRPFCLISDIFTQIGNQQNTSVNPQHVSSRILAFAQNYQGSDIRVTSFCSSFIRHHGVDNSALGRIVIASEAGGGPYSKGSAILDAMSQTDF